MLILEEKRCPECNRKLLNMVGQAEIKCPKCRAIVYIDTEARKIYVKPERRN